jgi:hypothetical protein
LVAAPGGLAGTAAYNEFPATYFQGALERGWLALAAVALAWGLVRRDRAMWLLGAWTMLVFLVLNLGPATWLVNNNAWAISLFLPGAVTLGWGADRWLLRARGLAASPENSGATPAGWHRARQFTGFLMAALAAGVAAYAAVVGVRNQAAIVNPVTVLATRDDLQALTWVDENLRHDARLLVNGWEWLNGIWAGSDGGSWLLPVTGRGTTLPPLDYAFDPDLAVAVASFNTRVSLLDDANTQEARGLFESAGVTHVFIGARGGHLRPEMFVDSPHYRLLFTNGPAWVFEVVRGEP